MATSHLSLKRIFNRYNRKYFNCELKADVQWRPLNTCSGIAYPNQGLICIDTGLMGYPKLLNATMLHEMVHLKHPRANHGKVFWREMDRLWLAGAFRKLL